MGLGEVLAAAFGHPLDHDANDLAGTTIRLRSAQTDEAVAKAKQARLLATRTEGENAARPGLGDALLGSTTPEARLAALVNAGGNVDQAAGASRTLGDALFEQKIADPTTDNATRQYAAAAIHGHYISPVEAVSGNGYVDPLHPETGVQATPVGQAKIDHPSLSAGGTTFTPDPADELSVRQAQKEGRIPLLLPRAYAMSAAMYKSLASGLRDNPNLTGADFGIMQHTTEAANKGPYADRITSVNSVNEHMNDWVTAMAELHNGNKQPFNALANAYADMTGDPAPTSAGELSQLLAAEMERTYVQNGGTEEGRKNLMQSFGTQLASGQYEQAAETGRKALAGVTASLEKRYKAGKGQGNFRADRLLPAAKAALEKYYPDEGPPQAPASIVKPTNPDAAAAAAAPVSITSDADFNKLASGTRFVGPDGKIRRKP